MSGVIPAAILPSHWEARADVMIHPTSRIAGGRQERHQPDPVNRSSRIERPNKSFATRILISGCTYSEAGINGGRALEPSAVKGIDKPLQLFTVGSKV
jgi:class 3 adenylate cyclase